ncbi:tripartite tricarboxylate transporter substrate binding protein [Alcaligenaceae bacterium]|nr:tripartite tricarboxylate transporter substrate binding protein [Alcaligenaceae bacterium]
MPISILRIFRSQLGRLCGLLLGTALIATPAHASYPDHPIRMIIGLQPGGSTDVLARQIASHLGTKDGWQLIIENRPGAATRIGMEAMSRSAADGYTLAIANAVSANFPMMFDDYTFKPGQDFVPVSLLGRAPSYIAIRASLPVKNVKEFIEYVKANAGKINYGHGSNGSNPHLAVRLLVQSLGLQATEVAYKGNAPTALALATGEIDFAILDYPSVRPLVERGSVRLIAVTEPKRAAMTPDIPTSTEQGLTPELEGVTPWFMLVAPAGTPEAVVSLLNEHFTEALKSPDVRDTALSLGIEPQGMNVSDSRSYFLEMRARAEELTRRLNISMKN